MTTTNIFMEFDSSWHKEYKSEEDYQCWDAYPQYRWLFNKLEVSLKLGYDCGPAGVPITKAGNYIIRPIYNLYGMGIGAHKKYLDPDKHGDDMIHHKHIPPGYFWCEWIDGTHYSVDFMKQDGKWVPFSSMIGCHYGEDNLVKFKEWEVIEPEFELPDWLHSIETERYLNIESKDDKIIEIHLRSGNDHIWNLNIGSKIYPVWEGDDYKDLEHLEFKNNMHPETCKYQADGHLSNIRLGHYIKHV